MSDSTTQKSNDHPHDVGGGASQLMDMFNAPPPTQDEETSPSNNKKNKFSSATTNVHHQQQPSSSHTSNLLNIFTPSNNGENHHHDDNQGTGGYNNDHSQSFMEVSNTSLDDGESPTAYNNYGSIRSDSTSSMKTTQRFRNVTESKMASLFEHPPPPDTTNHVPTTTPLEGSLNNGNGVAPPGLRLSTSFSADIAAYVANESRQQNTNPNKGVSLSNKSSTPESSTLQNIFSDKPGEDSFWEDPTSQYEVPVPEAGDDKAPLLPKPIKSTTWWDQMQKSSENVMDSVSHKTPIPWKLMFDNTFIKVQQFANDLQQLSIRHVLIGGILYTLYNIVFCLALASGTSNLQYRSHSMLGPFTKIGALGALAAIPTLLEGIGRNVPALYPTVDLFLAPFLMEAGHRMDESMNQQKEAFLAATSYDDNNELPHNLGDDAFLATFVAIISIGMLMTAVGNFVASKVKLANIGSYLPYSVLCGFFSFVGVTLWTLAISVDTGKGIGQILFSKNWRLMLLALIHHVPGAILGVSMFIFGPKFAILVPVLIIFVIGIVHFFMFLCRISLEEAQQNGWFWTGEELTYEPKTSGTGFLASWDTTKPLGVVVALITGKINFQAIQVAMPPIISMAFLYVLRCYIHATAFVKSCKNLVTLLETEQHQNGTSSKNHSPTRFSSSNLKPPSRSRGISTSSVLSDDGEGESLFSGTSNRTMDPQGGGGNGRMKIPAILTIVNQYGFGFLVTSIVGTTTAILPSIAVGPSIFKLGARGLAPQYASVPFLLYFYVTDFTLVQYIPKMVFSSLLVSSSIEMLSTWLIKSYNKMHDKLEWFVAPLIVAFSFLFGPLEAVGLGVATATFIFVSSFFKSGVVKFIANGLTIRSTIERNNRDAAWLDQNGDMIQVLVLQNFLFFGNASSCYHYIGTMFDDDSNENEEELNLPPIPKSLLLDMSLVTGMDTSTVDIFFEIASLCRSHKCILYIIGTGANVKSVLNSGGLTPNRHDRYVKFVSSLEIALGKAEDHLLSEVLRVEELEIKATKRQTHRRTMSGDSNVGKRLGFRYALEQIDQQHEIQYTDSLIPLENYTTVVELKPGESLFDSLSGDDQDDRGLFFIETGIMRVERDPSYSISRGSGASLRRRVKQEFDHPRLMGGNAGSVGHLNARSRSVAKMDALIKGTSSRNLMKGRNAADSYYGGGGSADKSKFRLARIGPGFVVGVNEASTGLRNIGIHVAVTECRLYFLSYDKINDMEHTDPQLILNLYKLLAHLSARREEVAIEQLSTLHTIMTSDPSTSSRPIDRKTLGAIQRAMQSIGP